MKIGIIGFGSIGKRHYTNLQKYNADIVILTKRKDTRANTAARWNEFIKKGPYDIFFITNETFKHIPTLKKCLKENPKAIFMEKPLSHNTKELRQISRIIKQKKVSVWVGYNFHFFKPFIKIKKLIADHALGKIYYVRASIGQDLRTWRPRDYRENYSAKKQQGGGVVLDLVHDINYPAWLLGEKLVPQSAIVRKLSQLEIDTEDCAETILMSTSGVIVTVHQDYLRVPRKQSIEISGEAGTIEWDSIYNTIQIETATKTRKEVVESERNEMFVDELKFFMNSVKQGKFFTNIDEAIHDMDIISYVKKYGKA